MGCRMGTVCLVPGQPGLGFAASTKDSGCCSSGRMGSPYPWAHNTSGTVCGPHGAPKTSGAPIQNRLRSGPLGHDGIEATVTCYSNPDQGSLRPPGCTARSSRATLIPTVVETLVGIGNVRMSGTQAVAPVATGHRGGVWWSRLNRAPVQ